MARTVISIFISSFVVGLSGALMPGPLLALTVSEVARAGFWAGPALVLGHAAAEFVTVIALAKGLGAALRRPRVIAVIAFVGAAFLLWMGYGLLSSLGRPLELDAAGSGAGTIAPSTVLAGFVVSVTNPYWVLWWATMGTTYVALSLQRRGARGLGSFYLGHELSDVAWYSVVSLALATGSRFISQTLYSWLLGACGAALVGLGIYCAYSGIRSLRRGGT